jgi:hypothetical protein
MEAILIDRQGTMVGVEEQMIKNLHELTAKLQKVGMTNQQL